jgi:opacity protein-like surface antigen
MGPVLLILALGLVALIPPEASAQMFEITPFVGYRFGGSLDVASPDFSKVTADPGLSYGITAGFIFDETYVLELMWSRQETELKGSGGTLTPEVHLADATFDQYQFNGLIHFRDEEDWFRPFVLVGLGLSHLNPKGDLSGSVNFSFGLGGGMKLYLGKHLGIRLQGRYAPTYLSYSSTVYCSLPGACAVATSGSFVHQGEVTGGVFVRF